MNYKTYGLIKTVGAIGFCVVSIFFGSNTLLQVFILISMFVWCIPEWVEIYRMVAKEDKT